MKKINVTANAEIYADISELSDGDKSLMEYAINSRKDAYAPYSKFKVGAAVLLDNGEVVTGNNQENAAYPSGMCAERVAIWKVGSQFPNATIKSIAISAASEEYTVDRAVGPCGACRQSLFEYEFKQKEPVSLLFMGEVGEVIKTESILSLLPFSFDSSYL